MENCAYPSYPDSGNSSPRSREMEFDNQPWDEQHQQHYKAKFMCSYGGKILPRPHDNQLSYVGGETKILSVDRNIKFHSLIAKLVALCGESDIAFRYQLPGEDLDALISVTNDDDLDHLMHEYDRLHRSSAKPVRMRLFVFPASANTGSSGTGEAVGADRDQFVEALDTVPAPDLPKPMPGKVDFLFGLEKRVSPPSPPPPVVPDPVVAAAPVGEVGLGRDDLEFVSDHGVSPAEMQRQLQELQRLQISGHGPEFMYRRKSEEAVIGGFGGGGGAPAGYWPDKQIPGGPFTGATMTGPPDPPEQPMYVIPGHGGLYHAPQMVQPVAGAPGHGYYAIQQRVGTDTYRDQSVFNVAPQMQMQMQPQPQPHPQSLSMAAPPTLPPQQHIQKMAGMTSTEGIVTGWPSGRAADHVAYAPAGYDGATGRQVFYTAAGGVVTAPAPPQFQGSAPETADMRPRGQVLGQDGKVIGKGSRASV